MDDNKREQKCILVVEDDPDFVKIITEKLEKNNIRVVNAKTADESMELLKNNHVDLIWLDHYLVGDKTGYDFVTSVKNDSKYRKIPIFLVTNYDDYGNTVVFMEKLEHEENPKTYVEFGIDKYFVKSNSSLDTILEEVKKYLKIE
ncbi:response regulator [candidate division WWE3 bacterium]|jgi:CheY-like chemotaxis protein|uniref:Response regulator n=1 Tax=candidate division WWE3 bacterium TaxID=2053526 RepID=A0A3A4ZKY8_UNCKA|nr:MAG: response regulator [candidate division WWE3 bacterium]